MTIMQITPGHGFLALAPERLSLRAFRGSYSGLGDQTAELGSTILDTRLLWGGMAACAGGALTVLDAPAEWDDTESQEVFIDLWCEHGQVQVYRAIAGNLDRRGRESQLTVISSMTPNLEGIPELDTNPLLDGSRISNAHQFGVALPLANNKGSRREIIESAINDRPDVDYGIHPSGSAIIGAPSSGTPAHISKALLGPQIEPPYDPQYTTPPYLTELLFAPPEPFLPQVYRRQDLLTTGRPLLPRRSATISPNPVTIREPETVQAALPSGPNPQAPVVGDGVERTYAQFSAAATTPHIIPIPRTAGVRIPRTAIVRIPYTCTAVVGGEAGMYVTVRTDTNQGKQFIVQFPLPAVGYALVAECEFKEGTLDGASQIEVTMAPAYQSTASSLSLRVNTISGEFSMETPNFGGLVFPPAWGMPYRAGPTWKRDLLRALVVPPFYDDDLGMYGGGVELNVQGGDSWVCTAHLGPPPYPRQTRGGR